MAKLVYNTEVRKRGYDWFNADEYSERLNIWDLERSDLSKRVKAGVLKRMKEDYAENFLLAPIDPTTTAQRTIKPMDTNAWVSFYRVAEKTKVGTDKPLPDDEIRAELLKFFKQHGIGVGEAIDFKYMRESLVMINDLYLARDESNMEEVYRILKGSRMENTNFDFNHIERFYFDIQAKLSLTDEGELNMVIEVVSFFDFILYDFLFSKGVLQRWFICKHCEEDFQSSRKKDYCSLRCKRRTAYERQLSKGKFTQEDFDYLATRRKK
jgi:hypothetical protein